MQFALLRRSEPGAGLQFAFDTDISPEVLIGRDPTCHVSLDPESDSIAALFHARIQMDPKSPSGLIVIDMSSRNGTFVDGVPVRGQAVLARNSSLILGRRDGQTGPEFTVNMGEAPWQQPVEAFAARPAEPPFVPEPSLFNRGPAPRPADLAAFPAPAAPPRAAGAGNWWEEQLPGVQSMGQARNSGVPGLPRNVSVKESKFRWVGAVVIGVSVLSVLLALWWVRQGAAPSAWTAQTIEQAYGKSMLATELTWKLVDVSGRQVYHWRPRLPFKPGDPRLAIFRERERTSVFIRMPDNSIEPVLILGPGLEGNEPAGGKTTGSAVAVNRGGFMLTERRNATPWALPYEWPEESFPGILIDPQTKQVDVIDRLNEPWMPLRARAVVAGEPTVANLAAGALSAVPVVLDGHLDLYRARPYNSTNWLQASPAATSEGSRLAVARLQSGKNLPEVAVPEADPPLALGQRVFVLGYVSAPQGTQLKTSEFQVLKAETTSMGSQDEFALLDLAKPNVNQNGSAVFDSRGRFAGLLRVLPRNGQFQGEIVPIRQGRVLLRSDGSR